MKASILAAMCVIALFASLSVAGQATVVVADPTKPAAVSKLSADEEAVFNKALPAVRKRLTSDVCTDGVEIAGVVRGAFTKAGSKQSLVFYQYCQTGNGLGWVGLVLIDGGNVVGNFVADVGWSVDIGVIPDINGNGLDEFTLSYGGGMHQGQGGVGVDVTEFANGRPKGLGWFQAEQFMDDETTTVWKVTVRPGTSPVFYKQKYLALEGGKWRRSGGNQLFRLAKSVGNFEVVK
jgi:hypothetical protein